MIIDLEKGFWFCVFILSTLSFFQGAIGDTTAAQAVLTINGVLNNPGHGNIFGGTVLGNIYATAAKSNSKPGAVIVTGIIKIQILDN